jgi:hypothetical protein
MTIDELINQARLRLVNLSQLRTSAERLGDTEQVGFIDEAVTQTQITLNRLLSL